MNMNIVKRIYTFLSACRGEHGRGIPSGKFQSHHALFPIAAVVASLLAMPAANGATDNTDPQESKTMQQEIDELLAEHPDAVQLNRHAISWNNGKVVLDLARSRKSNKKTYSPQIAGAGSGRVYGCPKGWFCFYEHYNFNGRRLQFSDCDTNGETQYLTKYGFGNQASSFVVNGDVDRIEVFDGNYHKIWEMYSRSLSSGIGPKRNDKAIRFTCYSEFDQGFA